MAFLSSHEDLAMEKRCYVHQKPCKVPSWATEHIQVLTRDAQANITNVITLANVFSHVNDINHIQLGDDVSCIIFSLPRLH